MSRGSKSVTLHRGSVKELQHLYFHSLYISYGAACHIDVSHCVALLTFVCSFCLYFGAQFFQSLSAGEGIKEKSGRVCGPAGGAVPSTPTVFQRR